MAKKNRLLWGMAERIRTCGGPKTGQCVKLWATPTWKESATSKKRWQYSPSFKAKVALSSIRNEETIAQLAAKYEAHPIMINNWKKALLEGAADLFDKGQKAHKHHDATVNELYKKITIFYPKGSVFKTQCMERDANKSHSGLSRQCRLLNINRSSFYYKPRPISTDDLEMMKEIDAEYMIRPAATVRSAIFLQDRATRLIASGFNASCDWWV